MAAKKKTGGRQKDVPKVSPAHEAGFCMYIGPTIMGVIQNGTVFRGTKAEALSSVSSDVIEKYPLIASLIVSDSTLAEDRIKVKTPGNWLYVNYHKLRTGKK